MKKKLQVIVKKDNFKEYKKGNILNVSPGYALNYLIPNGIAEIATKNKMKHFQMFIDIERKREKENSIAIQKTKHKLEKIRKISTYKKQGENYLIFGSIKEKEITSWIKEHMQLEINKKTIKIHNINQIGINHVDIQIQPGITMKIELYIIPNNI